MIYEFFSHALNSSSEIFSASHSCFFALACFAQAENCSSEILPALIQAKCRLYSRRYSLNTRSFLLFFAHFCTGAIFRQSFPDGCGLLQYSAVIRPIIGKYLPQFLHRRRGIFFSTQSRREKSIMSRIVSGYRIVPQVSLPTGPKLAGIGWKQNSSVSRG